ncbi:hypothetical protein PPBDW_I20292 [Photobacterium kishitanii]|nr:hypothetical protein PPBDW_I20292 [Photobacterium kishitanii]
MTKVTPALFCAISLSGFLFDGLNNIGFISHLAPRTSHLAPRTSHLAPRTSYLPVIRTAFYGL